MVCYKGGDTVTIRSDLRHISNTGTVSSMYQYAGKVTRILKLLGSDACFLEVDNGQYIWDYATLLPNGLRLEL